MTCSAAGFAAPGRAPAAAENDRYTLGRLRRLQGKLEEAQAALAQSLATEEHPSPPHQWRMAATHLEYDLTLQEMGDLVGARDHLTRLGPQHPRTEQAGRCLVARDATRP